MSEEDADAIKEWLKDDWQHLDQYKAMREVHDRMRRALLVLRPNHFRA